MSKFNRKMTFGMLAFVSTCITAIFILEAARG